MKTITIARSRKVGLSLVNAAFLEEVCRQVSKSKIQRDGKTWAVLPRETWMSITGLTEWNYREATKKLRSLGILVIELHKFEGTPTNFIPVDLPRFEEIEAKTGELTKAWPA